MGGRSPRRRSRATHMINYKQMRDENMMHLVMISAQKKKKPGLMNLTLLIMMRKIHILRTSSIY